MAEMKRRWETKETRRKPIEKMEPYIPPMSPNNAIIE